ncbi:hypothetical protein EVAR_96583_1 [Eumeta japonica]|uniref:Uncharacterized protein n=1 Tax=Eumeta variegata TaxID=151549 RepID=A0A4C1WUW8_EUMVA|nr:hypothetical protein EVAR_96583_1 [Eumeta japonica]
MACAAADAAEHERRFGRGPRSPACATATFALLQHAPAQLPVRADAETAVATACRSTVVVVGATTAAPRTCRSALGDVFTDHIHPFGMCEGEGRGRNDKLRKYRRPRNARPLDGSAHSPPSTN